MAARRPTPAALASRLGARMRDPDRHGASRPIVGPEGSGPIAQTAWRRETFALPRDEARQKAHEWFAAWPKAAYMTEIEFWQELEDGRIEFTIRRLPSAD